MIRTNHIRILFSMVLMFAFGLTTISAQDDDSLTQDDFDLILLENGDVAIGEFFQADQAQLFGFNGSAGDNVTIEMTQGRNSDIDPYLVLLSAEGAVLAVDDDGNNDVVAHAAQIRNFPLPEDGTYLILATTWNGRRSQRPNADDESFGEQDYQVSVRGNRQPNNFNEGDFELFITYMDIGDGRNLRLTPERPVVLVITELFEGDVISLESRSQDSNVETLIQLFDPFGARLGVSELDNRSSEIDSFEADEDGIYLIFVTVYDFTNALNDNIDLGNVELVID